LGRRVTSPRHQGSTGGQRGNGTLKDGREGCKGGREKPYETQGGVK